MRGLHLRCFLCVWMMIAAGCATHPSAPSLAISSVELTDVPFFAQLEHQCGPAALATLLSYQGRLVSPADLLSQVYIEGLKGSLQAELLSATRRHGLIPYVLEPQPQDIVAEVAAGHPVVVLQNLGFRVAPIWHYAVVVGFDDATDSVILRSGSEARRLERTAKFVRSWRRASGWAFIALRAGELPATARSDPYLRALLDVEQYLTQPEISRAYENAIARWPQDEMIMFAVATRRLQEASWQEAEEMYRELLTRQPNHAAARNNLASVLLAREHYDAALREAELALEQAQDPRLIAAIKDTLASIETSSTHVGRGLPDATSPSGP